MFLVPIWGGPSGVYMFACVRYFWVHTTKKSLVIFCSNSGGGDSSRVFTWVCYSCPRINQSILVLLCDANAHRRELDPRSTRRKNEAFLRGFGPNSVFHDTLILSGEKSMVYLGVIDRSVGRPARRTRIVWINQALSSTQLPVLLLQKSPTIFFAVV